MKPSQVRSWVADVHFAANVVIAHHGASFQKETNQIRG